MWAWIISSHPGESPKEKAWGVKTCNHPKTVCQQGGPIMHMKVLWHLHLGNGAQETSRYGASAVFLQIPSQLLCWSARRDYLSFVTLLEAHQEGDKREGARNWGNSWGWPLANTLLPLIMLLDCEWQAKGQGRVAKSLLAHWPPFSSSEALCDVGCTSVRWEQSLYEALPQTFRHHQFPEHSGHVVWRLHLTRMLLLKDSTPYFHKGVCTYSPWLTQLI